MVYNFLFYSILINYKFVLTHVQQKTLWNLSQKYLNITYLFVKAIKYPILFWVILQWDKVSTGIRPHLLPILRQANKRIYWVLNLMWKKSHFHLCFISETYETHLKFSFPVYYNKENIHYQDSGGGEWPSTHGKQKNSDSQCWNNTCQLRK